MRTRLALGFAMVSTIALASSFSLADTASDVGPKTVKQSTAAQVTLVASGAKRGRIDGEQRLRYPGFEQTTLVSVKNHIVLITMESVQERDRGPVQCSCSSYELRPDGPPREVVSLKRLTEYSNGERTCNHPKAAADELGNIVWMYGSDYNNNRPNTYAGILNEKCEQLASPIMVNVARDANDGAPDLTYQGGGIFMGSYYSDGGGEGGLTPDQIGKPVDPITFATMAGGDYSMAMGLSIDNSGALPTLKRNWLTAVVTPTTIGRPTVATIDATRALLCAGKGANRPTDVIECGMLDTVTGNVVTKNEFFKYAPAPGMGGMGRKYMNQPTIAKVADNQFALMAIESNGMGKNTNIKGSNVAHMMMLERNGDSLIGGGEIVGAAAHQTHASICVGGYGEQGNTAVGVFSASPTGIGRAAMAMVQYDQPTKTFKYNEREDLWPAAWYGDSGHLSNWYGRNPMRQGRDYMRCIGGVTNPGYHVANGYMSDVKTFFAGAVHGRIPGDEKNSLFLSLIPGQMDKKPLPQNPVVAGEEPTLEPDTTTVKNEGPKADSGCGCTTPGSSTTGSTAGLAGLALGIGIIVSRRRRSK
jgi:hypothetical protein